MPRNRKTTAGIQGRSQLPWISHRDLSNHVAAIYIGKLGTDRDVRSSSARENRRAGSPPAILKDFRRESEPPVFSRRSRARPASVSTFRSFLVDQIHSLIHSFSLAVS
jgi:hypothetical protein